MRCTERLHHLHLRLENSINKLVRRCLPTLPDGTLRKMWLIFYTLFGICWLGGALLSCLGTALLTIGGYWALQEYYPTVSTNELTKASHIGRRVCFEVTELTSDETIAPTDRGYRIPAITYAHHHARVLTTGHIRLNIHPSPYAVFGIYAADDQEATAWRRQLQTALQAQGLSQQEQESEPERYTHSYIPPHITGRFLVQGQLTRPNEVLVHQLESTTRQKDTTPRDEAIIIIGLFSITSLLILTGIWGWIWCLRSFQRIRKGETYRAPSELLATALLQGGSLVVLSYLAGYTAIVLAIELCLLTYPAPYLCQPCLQWVMGVSLIFILQLSSYRLRQCHP